MVRDPMDDLDGELRIPCSHTKTREEVRDRMAGCFLRRDRAPISRAHPSVDREKSEQKRGKFG